tara:strand:+ start:3876 stop:5663 length:1788 start_codon:yes stop_codon:yes gene_type:complete
MTDQNKIRKLQLLLKKEKLDAYLVPMRNETLSSDLKWHDNRIKSICNFTGSAGVLIITSCKNALFVDGRYTQQAKLQIDQDIFNINPLNIKSQCSWLNQILGDSEKNKIVGYDPKLHSIAEIEKYNQQLVNNNYQFRSIHKNLVDQIYTRTPRVENFEISYHDLKYSGEKTIEKLEKIRSENIKRLDEALFIQDKELISWIFNLRSYKKKFNPSIEGIAIITKNEAFLCCDKKQLQPNAISMLGIDLTIIDQTNLQAFLDLRRYNIDSISLDKDTTSMFFMNIFMEQKKKIKFKKNPVTLKSIKNLIEINGMKIAHQIDGLSLCNFIYWFKNTYKNNNIYELDLVKKLEEFRKNNSNTDYLGPSFPSIVGYNENGSIIHYVANKDSNKVIRNNGLLLIDSGGHYKYGTTDISRTLSVGTPSAEMIKNYTLVLKAHIALADAKFNYLTSGKDLDQIARAKLKNYGFDYNHGTGHGVGSVLSVHEGPLSISPNYINSGFEPGMIFSNEPGIYIENKFGIRIENIMLVCNDENIQETKSLYFDILSFVPFEKALIKRELLDPEEIIWINNYHKRVREKILPLASSPVDQWIIDATITI